MIGRRPLLKGALAVGAALLFRPRTPREGGGDSGWYVHVLDAKGNYWRLSILAGADTLVVSPREWGMAQPLRIQIQDARGMGEEVTKCSTDTLQAYSKQSGDCILAITAG